MADLQFGGYPADDPRNNKGRGAVSNFKNAMLGGFAEQASQKPVWMNKGKLNNGVQGFSPARYDNVPAQTTIPNLQMLPSHNTVSIPSIPSHTGLPAQPKTVKPVVTVASSLGTATPSVKPVTKPKQASLGNPVKYADSTLLPESLPGALPQTITPTTQTVAQQPLGVPVDRIQKMEVVPSAEAIKNWDVPSGGGIISTGDTAYFLQGNTPEENAKLAQTQAAAPVQQQLGVPAQQYVSEDQRVWQEAQNAKAMLEATGGANRLKAIADYNIAQNAAAQTPAINYEKYALGNKHAGDVVNDAQKNLVTGLGNRLKFESDIYDTNGKIKVGEISADANKYHSKLGYDGTVYNADKHFQGVKTTAEESARARAAATKDAAENRKAEIELKAKESLENRANTSAALAREKAIASGKDETQALEEAAIARALVMNDSTIIPGTPEVKGGWFGKDQPAKPTQIIPKSNVDVNTAKKLLQKYNNDPAKARAAYANGER